MADETYADLPSDAEQSAPSPFGRVALAFTSPTRAFANLGKGGSWWAPYLVLVIVSLGLAATMGRTVGWETVTRNNIASSPKQQARFDQAPAAQQEQQIAIAARFTRIAIYIGFILGPLVLSAIIAAILLATFNFGLGASARFGPLFAVYLLSSMPQVIKSLLAILFLLLGVGRESFLTSNPVGSNLAYYLQGSSAPHWLLAMLSWFDVFLIWQVVLLVIGCAMVAKVSRGRAAAVVIGWVVLFMLVTTAVAAA